jgi:hypothetical protein
MPRMHLALATVNFLLAILLRCLLDVLPEIFDDGIHDIVRSFGRDRRSF